MKPRSLLWLSLWLISLACLWALPSASPTASAQATSDRAVSPVATKVLAFARGAQGKTIGRGECWDLAQAALTQAGAAWDGRTRFGRELGGDDAIQPGDVIQFRSLRLEWRNTGGSGWTQLGFPDHTAIVLAAKGSQLHVAHQNYNQVRKVVFTTIDLRHRVSGSWVVYRPVAKTG